MSSGSVTHWIGRLKAGDGDAAQRLWEAYFARLVRLARAKLPGHRKHVADEEDVALSTFDSFCHGARDGRFPKLTDRNNLWACWWSSPPARPSNKSGTIRPPSAAAQGGPWRIRADGPRRC